MKEYIILLFAGVLGGGLAFSFLSKISESYRNIILTFSGAYLFSITVIHLLPDAFSMANKEITSAQIGIFLLVGFFLQKVLEYFSQGVEHGHLHIDKSSSFSAIGIIIALSIHALLEGSVLTQHDHIHHHGHHHHHVEHNASLLWGIVFHKAPAAFVLTTILLSQLKSKKKVLLYLSLFVLASPIGLLIGNYVQENQLISSGGFIILFAIVAGNFLHISTTIFYESNPNHHFNLKKVSAIVIGVVGAILTQYLS
ncbi:MAG: zinc permease [Cytophagales bacterium]|nr:zinc permease [Cytophagales bacterium]